MPTLSNWDSSNSSASQPHRGVHAKLSRLALHDNAIGPLGVRPLAISLRLGALQYLSVLRLSNTQMRCEGIAHLADALADTRLEVLAHCRELYLNDNEIADGGMEVFASAIAPTLDRPKGTLANCEVLALANNHVARDGVLALADACAAGALPQMKRFLMSSNRAPALPVVEAISKARAAGVDREHVQDMYVRGLGKH